MEIVWIILGSFLMLAGLIGSFLPVLPGPPISYLGLLLIQVTSGFPFSTSFMVGWALLVLVIMLIDNAIPAWGTRRFGGSVYGVWGSIIGLTVGLVMFTPVGIIAGPLAGAFLGELVGGKSSKRAFRSALGSFVGFLAGTLIKVIASGMMGYYFYTAI